MKLRLRKCINKRIQEWKKGVCNRLFFLVEINFDVLLD